MPPKKKPNEPSKKTELKKKEKVIEDKTFGLKNKKGAKNQKFIQQVQQQVKCGNVSARKLDQDKVKKDDKKKDADELNMIFKPVITQKIEKGADPKSVLCAFFKQGQCGKGDKCKFSHDLSIERKAEKKSVYTDIRDEDSMENWDEEKLKEVVEKKHGEAERKMPKTDIICKHFLDALEKSKYGWFWECPNGGNKCHYRHALPPGFVLNKDKKKEKKEDTSSLEDHIELQRAQLGSSLTKINLETFLAWKKRKLQEKTDRETSEQDRKRAEFKAGRHVGLSGRDMFTFRPEMAEEDATEEGESALDIRLADDDEEEENGAANNTDDRVYEISIESLSREAREADGTGTVADIRHWNSTEQQPQDLQDGASGGTDEDGDGIADVPIDENLFDDDDLDEIEESLNDLDIE